MGSSAISNLGGGQPRFRTRLAMLGGSFWPCIDDGGRAERTSEPFYASAYRDSDPLLWPRQLGWTEIRRMSQETSRRMKG